MVSSTDPSIIVPLSADVTTANVSDIPVYPDLLSSSTSSSSSLSLETLKKIYFVVADPGYIGTV